MVWGALFWQLPRMARTIILYAIALALAAAALDWLQYRYAIHAFSTEIYVGLLALGFTALGIWAGARLTPRPAGGPFQRNQAAVRSLGLTPRECEILGLLASGRSNKEMARRLDISPNTVKTHIASVYAKLEVQKRMQAVEKARMLSVIE
jgi:DNA-binding CsgD family transcriptional regulator